MTENRPKINYGYKKRMRKLPNTDMERFPIHIKLKNGMRIPFLICYLLDEKWERNKKTFVFFSI